MTDKKNTTTTTTPSQPAADRAITRRKFVAGATATAAATAMRHIVPRHCLGAGQTPPSEKVGAALIGVGGRGPGTLRSLSNNHKLPTETLAVCDVAESRLARHKQRFGQKADAVTDFRRVLEREDIDVVAIATPPHWHALISIMAMQAGKDVLCEKPMTRFVAEGRAVADAAKRYGRVYQVGTYGRFGASGNAGHRETHKIMRASIAGKIKLPHEVVHIRKGGFKVKQWSGRADLSPDPIPDSLDWDLYCGPSPLKPFVRPRHGGTHRWYWDYDGGGLGDMGQHHLDPLNWIYGRDDTGPVEITPYAPPAHPEVAGMWGWAELKYADGFTLVLESGEWGKPYDRKPQRGISLNDLSAEDRKTVEAMPDPEPLLGFGEAVQQRKQAGGNAEAAHRTACLMHLANVAIRVGRTVKFDPVKEVAVGDDEANRLINQPMRAPWHL